MPNRNLYTLGQLSRQYFMKALLDMQTNQVSEASSCVDAGSQHKYQLENIIYNCLTDHRPKPNSQ